ESFPTRRSSDLDKKRFVLVGKGTIGSQLVDFYSAQSFSLSAENPYSSRSCSKNISLPVYLQAIGHSRSCLRGSCGIIKDPTVHGYSLCIQIISIPIRLPWIRIGNN